MTQESRRNIENNRNVRYNRSSGYGRNQGNGDYVYGSAAPKIDIRRQIRERPVHRTSQTTKKNRAKQYAWGPAYIALLTVCMVITGGMLMYRVKLEAMVTSQVATVNMLEKQLNDLRVANDEEWSRVNNSIDLEEIRRIAISELGMTYAQEGQIVTYVGGGEDYMRKVVED